MNDENVKADDLLRVVNVAEDTVFAEFCRRIGVANIREYEDVQLRAAEEESEARVKFDTQIARLTHQ
jgi:structural maintenance of chromosome 1